MADSWTVKEGGRLDAFLAENVSGLSRAKAQKLIKDGSIEVDGEVVTKTSKNLQKGSNVVILGGMETESETVIEPIDLNLSVLYEDDSCFVIEKPAGYAVHPATAMASDEKTILHGIAFLMQERSLPFSADSVLVHRLDKETTGCLLVAKTPEAHAFLQKQFEDRTVKKMYLALVAGVPDPAEAIIDSPIGRNLTDRTKMSILKTSVSREARTTYKTLDATDDATLVRCELHTGRTHQVRVHLSSIGHPILGDPTYASSQSEKLTKEYSIGNLCLHAWTLTFTSPIGARIDVTAPLPLLVGKALERVGISFFA